MNIPESPVSCDDFIHYKTLRTWDVFNFSGNTLEFHKYLRKVGLLGDFSGKCKKCVEGELKYSKDGLSSHTGKQRYNWRCSNRKCRAKITPKTDSFFEKAKLCERAVFIVIYYWVFNISQEQLQRDLGITSKTSVDWYNFCRNVCRDILLEDNKKIGGPQAHS